MPLRLRSAGGGGVTLKPPVALSTEAAIEVPAYDGAKMLTDKTPGMVLRSYYAYNNTGIQASSSTPFDIGLNFSNVVINAGEIPLLSLHVSLRGDGTSAIHTALKLRYTGSATGEVGHGTYGIGITNPAYSWSLYQVANLNLKQVRQNPFNSVGTFNFFVQATTGSLVVFGGEVGGGAALSNGYAGMQGTILIVKE